MIDNVDICKIKIKFVNRYLICNQTKFPSNHGEVSVMFLKLRCYPFGVQTNTEINYLYLNGIITPAKSGLFHDSESKRKICI